MATSEGWRIERNCGLVFPQPPINPQVDAYAVNQTPVVFAIKQVYGLVIASHKNVTSFKKYVS